jgi:hypothetical protein
VVKFEKCIWGIISYISLYLENFCSCFSGVTIVIFYIFNNE